MNSQINIFAKLLNITILILVILYTFLYYFSFISIILSGLIITISTVSFLLKIFYWNKIKKILKKNNKQKENILKIFFCIFTYILPSYYILVQSQLIVSNNIILFTLIIISIFTLVGILLENYLNILEKKYLNEYF